MASTLLAERNTNNMGLPPLPKGKNAKPLPPGDPIRKAFHQLEEYEEGTPKRTVRDHTSCCVIDTHAHGKKGERT